MTLQHDLKTIQDELALIAAKAKDQNRELNATECKQIEVLGERALGLKAQIDRVEKSEKALADLIAFGGSGDDDDDNPRGVKYLALSGTGAKAAAQRIGAGIRESSLERGVKAFPANGTITYPTPLVPEPIEKKRIPTSIIDLLRVVPRRGRAWTGIRQTGFANNAQIVPAGATKPTSTITIEPLPGEVAVIAHLSEPVDKYLLNDNSHLAEFIQRNLLWGLRDALEEEVLNGDGSADEIDDVDFKHFTGIFHTTGVQQQAALADPLVTLRASSTKLETIGFESSVYILNPFDWEAIETARNLSGAFDLGSAVNRAERKVWDTQVVTSPRMPQGTSVTADLTALNLDMVEDDVIEILWHGSGELFKKNQLEARVEGRFGLTIERPEGIVVSELVAADES